MPPSVPDPNFADCGHATVTVAGVTLELDLYEVNNRLAGLHQANRDKPANEYHAAVQDLMAELGYPRVSMWCADKWAAWVFQAAADLAKKNGTGPDSPGSTGSTPTP